MPRADFLSLTIPSVLRDAVQALPIPKSWQFEPMHPANLHMTLVFLGDKLRHSKPKIREKLEEFIQEFHVQQDAITFDRLELFPPSKRNLLIARFRVGPRTMEQIQTLQQQCFDLQLTHESPQNTPFVAHITLGKFRGAKPADIERIQHQLDTEATWLRKDLLPPLENQRCCQWYSDAQKEDTSALTEESMRELIHQLNLPALRTGHDGKRRRIGEPLAERYHVHHWDVKQQCVVQRELPFNFSWVIPGDLAGSSLPRSREDLLALRDVGVRHIVTLLEHPPEWYDSCKDLTVPSPANDHLHFHFFAVDDRTPPTQEQLNAVSGILRQHRQSMMVHCKGGYGRTNVMLAAILMQFKGMAANQAIEHVKCRRPHMILSESQQTFLFKLPYVDISALQAPTDTNTNNANNASNTSTGTEKKASSTSSGQTPAPIAPSTTTTTSALPLHSRFPAAGASSAGNIKMIMFVGLPASGKSSLSKHIEQQMTSESVVRVNYDEHKGAKSKQLFSEGLKSSKKLILLDNCNLTRTKRAEWLSSMLSKEQHVLCVFVDTPPEDCRLRIQLRADHPSLAQGEGAAQIVDTNNAKLEPPTVAEGFVRVEHLRTQHDIDTFLKQAGFAPMDTTVFLELQNEQYQRVGLPPILKFPRTKHVVNLGSATKDDALFTPAEVTELLRHVLIVEEKVDGGNLGFSLMTTPEQYVKVCVQNRTHYIKSSEHPQYEKLDKWTARHLDELSESILLNPEHEILYGEWLYMTHSIPYTRLPGECIVYDIFDRRTGRELTRAQLTERLAGTSIPQVAEVVPPRMYSSIDELVTVLKNARSAYRDGPPEGVYVRALSSDGKNIVMRGKIVLPGFVAGSAFIGKKSAHQKILRNGVM